MVPRRVLLVLLMLTAYATARSQTQTLKTESTLVLAPVRIQSSNGELVHNLTAQDFVLTDDGIPQTVHLEDATHEPLAIVVLMQTGGTAPRQFPKYAGIATLLQNAFSPVAYRVSLVTFDSQPEDRWPFSSDVTHLANAFTAPKAGDKSAAVLDAVEYGLDWLDDQHPPGRRMILLISDDHFQAPGDRMEQALHRLAATNTAVYSLSYSGETQWLKDQFTQERRQNGAYVFSPTLPPLSHTFNLDGPLRHAIGSMNKNVAASVAALSGGMFLPFGDRRSLELQLMAFANDLNNRYILSFQPTSSKEGLHELHVQLPAHPELQVTVRQGYWRQSPSQTP
ncbi:MAG: VWA domain-containing protein [Terriglobus sp.]